MLNTLKELCLLNGVSGDEDEVRRYLVSRVKSRATHFHADAIGNLIVFKKGKKSTGNRLMLAAHMDEVGIIIPHHRRRFPQVRLCGRSGPAGGHRQAGGHRTQEDPPGSSA